MKVGVKNMKKIISIILTIILAMGIMNFSFAEEYVPEDTNDYSHELEVIDGTPKLARWKYKASTMQGCLVDGSGYTGNGSVNGYSQVTKITIFMYPQKKSGDGWTNLTTFQDTRNGRSLAVEHYYSPCSRGTYRTRCSYYVYVGDTFEHIIAYSPEYTY